MSRKLFQNKYRTTSTRWQRWNYANIGAYFITICTKNRVHYFGEINESHEENPMILSQIGEIVETEWLKTPQIRPDMNLHLDEYVVMPNHFHAILVIGENQFNTKTTDNGIVIDGAVEAQCIAPLQCITPLQYPSYSIYQNQMLNNKFGPQRKNLGSIVRGFKSSVTMQARNMIPDFTWQKRFHDHVIRDKFEYLRIADYIIHNPYYWAEDNFNQPFDVPDKN